MNDGRFVVLKYWITPIAVFILALVVRVWALGQFVTIDEPRWLERSRWFSIGLLFPDWECPPVEWGRDFATQGWGCTFQIGYPGVTTMWGGSLGLGFYYWWKASSTGVDIATFLQTLPVYRLDPAIMTPIELPMAITGALFIPLFYILLRRLLSERVALVAVLLLALQPFHIGLSRVLHHDALNTTFMVLSVLALAGYWLRGWPWYWLPISAVMAGLAFLSKQVSWFMIPYVGILGGLTLYYRWRSEDWRGWAEVWRLVGAGMLWGAVAGLIFIAFFPAMWVMPGEVLWTIFSQSAGLAQEGHPHYFLGQITQDPGPLFYLVGWLLRASPLEVLGILGALAAVWPLFRWWSRRQQVFNQPVEIALALFVGLLWLFVSVSDKKLVRFFLPAFPVIDVFVAMGLLWLLDRLAQISRSEIIQRWGIVMLSGVILLFQLWLVAPHYPYLFTYYNPLLGGAPGAARLMTIDGWGEGLNEAAAYLNQKPNAESLQVVVERWCNTFSPYFVGKVNCLNSSVGGILRADYFVYYYNLLQFKILWLEQWEYFEKHYSPEYRVTLHGLDYILIYRNPIQYQVDQKANSLPKVFTAFGYNLASDGQFTLFWQNLGLGQQQLLIGLAPSNGVYTIDAPTANTDGNRQWVACQVLPAFKEEMNTPKAVIESLCPLTTANLPPGLYDLQLGLSDGAATTPLASSFLGVLLINPDGRFTWVELDGEKRVSKDSAG